MYMKNFILFIFLFSFSHGLRSSHIFNKPCVFRCDIACKEEIIISDEVFEQQQPCDFTTSSDAASHEELKIDEDTNNNKKALVEQYCLPAVIDCCACFCLLHPAAYLYWRVNSDETERSFNSHPCITCCTCPCYVYALLEPYEKKRYIEYGYGVNLLCSLRC